MIEYKNSHIGYHEKAIFNADGILFYRGFLWKKLKELKINYSDIEGHALIPYVFILPKNTKFGRFDGILVIWYKSKKIRKKLLFYVNTEGPKVQNLLSRLPKSKCFNENMTRQSMMALRVYPYRYYAAVALLFMLLVLGSGLTLSYLISGHLIMIPLLLAMAATYFISQRIYAGW